MLTQPEAGNQSLLGHICRSTILPYHLTLPPQPTASPYPLTPPPHPTPSPHCLTLLSHLVSPYCLTLPPHPVLPYCLTLYYPTVSPCITLPPHPVSPYCLTPPSYPNPLLLIRYKMTTILQRELHTEGQLAII